MQLLAIDENLARRTSTIRTFGKIGSSECAFNPICHRLETFASRTRAT